MTIETYADIIDYIRPEFEAVNHTIRNNLDSDVALIKTLAEYVIASGGKRMRPILTILAGKAVSDKPNPKLPIAAAVVEYIHTATLIHDDVVDHSDQRRGKNTANNVWGNQAAVLVGDFLYSRAFQLMQELDSLPIQNLFADATNRIAEGEVMQLLNIGNIDLTEAEYFDIIEAKTAVLFSAACQIGAMVNGGTPEQIHALGEYGRHLGIAFQLMDDILDYEGDPELIGKNIGDDLNEGKITLPIIFMLAREDGAQQQKLIRLLEQAQHEELSKDDTCQILSMVRQTNIISKCCELTEKQLKRTESILNKQLTSLASPTQEALRSLIRLNQTRKS